MKAQPASAPFVASQLSTRASRGQRVTAVAVFVGLVCSGASSCTKTQVALSSAGIAAVLVGTTVGVTLAVQHHNHTLQGCVFSDADGLGLRTGDAKVYALKGEVAGIKVGHRVSFHGTKKKNPKGALTGNQAFLVEKLNKDYGPCSGSSSTAPTSSR